MLHLKDVDSWLQQSGKELMWYWNFVAINWPHNIVTLNMLTADNTYHTTIWQSADVVLKFCGSSVATQQYTTLRCYIQCTCSYLVKYIS